MRTTWKRASVMIAATLSLAVLQTPVGSAKEPTPDADRSKIHASSRTVVSLLGTNDLSGFNKQIKQARLAGDVAEVRKLGKQATAADGFKKFMKSVGDLRTSAGTSLQSEIHGLLRRAEAANANSDEVEGYVKSLKFSDGARLVDKIEPSLLYSRSHESTTVPTSQPGSEICALAGCSDPIPPDPNEPLCGGDWIYYAKNERDFDWYFFGVEVHHLWAKTQARKKCSTNLDVNFATVVDRIKVKVSRYKDYWHDGFRDYFCQDLVESRTSEAFNTHEVSVSWNRTAEEFPDSGEGDDRRFTGSQHWVDFDNWHHRSSGIIAGFSAGSGCSAPEVPSVNS